MKVHVFNFNCRSLKRINTSIGGIGERQASQTLSMQLEWQAASRHESHTHRRYICKKNNIDITS